MKWKYAVLPALTAVIILGIIGFAYLHGADITILHPQGPIALQERRVIGLTVLLCAGVVVPLFFMLFLFAWLYRADNPKAKKEHEPNWDHDSWVAEFFWWVVPSAIIVFLSFIAWQSSHQLDPYLPLQSEESPLTVQVVALDWKWLFIYPDQGIATVNYLEFPSNRPIHFEITADAPMNQFWIPALGGQIMAMPGMQTQINLESSSLGTYKGLSSEISGKGFAGMNFEAKSVTDADFATWVTGVKAMQHPLNGSTYALLAEPSEYNASSSYSSVAGDLYTASIMKYMMPAGQMKASTTGDRVINPSSSMQGMNGMNMSGMQMGPSNP